MIRHGMPMKARIDKKLTEKGARKRYEIEFSREGEPMDAIYLNKKDREILLMALEELDTSINQGYYKPDEATPEDVATLQSRLK